MSPTRRRDALLLLWPAVAALTPKCPLCLFAILGATGAAGAALAAWMPLLLVGSLLVSVSAVCIRSHVERRYGPAVFAVLAAVAVAAGKFLFQSTAVVYAGAAALFAAAVFNFTLERLRWHKPLAL
jgi:hypothetical protein